jgi:spore maturation protein CgeB
VQEIIINASIAQRMWALENNVWLAPTVISSSISDYWMRNIRLGIDMYSGNHFFGSMSGSLQKIALAQIKQFKPDVIFDADLMAFSKHIKKELRSHCKLLIGESGYALPKRIDLSAYDILLSCDPAYVEVFKASGLNAYYWPHAFEDSVLDEIDISSIKKTRGIVFTGSVGRYHKLRREIILEASKQLPIEVFGKFDDAPSNLNVKPAVFGDEMLKILASAQISFNSHYDIAERYAANMRLFEATGVGSCLLTDWKENLHELFALDREVISYKNVKECIEKAKWLISNPKQCSEIAKAGQSRTLKDHTLKTRMDELNNIIRKHL